jgi:hypothetical protein
MKEQLAVAHQRIGEITMDNELLWERARRLEGRLGASPRPFRTKKRPR